MLHPKHLCVRVGGVCPGKAQRAPAAQGLVLGSDAMVVEQVWGVMGAKIVDIYYLSISCKSACRIV
eukprot:scaffold219674_cov92-Attheya_sp.AAC.1